MRRSGDRILTTHIGSLPRSSSILGALTAGNAGQDTDAQQFETYVRAAVDEIVAQQVAAGVTIVNDGEQSKFAYLSYQLDRLTGFEVVRTRSREEAEAIPQGSAAERADFPEFFRRWKWASEMGERAAAAGLRVHGRRRVLGP
jgi:5-methyltetrahydropteroyltriglutamate--homocysteine methyltransferase